MSLEERTSYENEFIVKNNEVNRLKGINVGSE
jgi:hypothetical protein